MYPMRVKSTSTDYLCSSSKKLPTSIKYPLISESRATQWQIGVHEGFITSFMSTLGHFPGSTLHESWKRLALLKNKPLIIGASRDPIVIANELREDTLKLLGPDKFEWVLIEGAHDIPVSDPGEIVDAICKFWKM